MHDNTVIQIRHSTANNRPLSLNIGELAYSFTSNMLFIGTASNNVINIGGQTIANAVENKTALNIPNSIVYRDSNGNFNANIIYAAVNTAVQFSTPRYINITGDVGNTSNLFDGNANADIILKLDDTGINSGT